MAVRFSSRVVLGVALLTAVTTAAFSDGRRHTFGGNRPLAETTASMSAPMLADVGRAPSQTQTPLATPVAAVPAPVAPVVQRRAVKTAAVAKPARTAARVETRGGIVQTSSRYHDDGRVRVRAPHTNVKVRGHHVRVTAPYTRVGVDEGRVRVRAPYVNLDIRW